MYTDILMPLGTAEAVAEVLREQREKATTRGLMGGWDIEITRTEDTGRNPIVSVSVIGSSPKIAGHTVIALYDRLGDDKIIIPVAGTEDIGADSLTFECDHCHSNRARIHMLLLEDHEGNRMQVGTACAKDYLGWRFQAHDLMFPPDIQALFEGADPDEIGFGGASRIWSHDVVLRSFAVIEAFGWHPKSEPGTPTADLIFDPRVWDGKSDETAVITDETLARTNKALEWARTNESTGDYLSNLRVLAGQETVSERHLGMLVSLAAAWLREQRWTADREATEDAPKELLAPIKTRVRNVPVTLLAAREIESYYGLSTLYTFKCKSGHLIKWFSSRPLGINPQDTGTLTATVKKEDAFRGVFSTIVTRGVFSPA